MSYDTTICVGVFCASWFRKISPFVPACRIISIFVKSFSNEMLTPRPHPESSLMRDFYSHVMHNPLLLYHWWPILASTIVWLTALHHAGCSRWGHKGVGNHTPSHVCKMPPVWPGKHHLCWDLGLCHQTRQQIELSRSWRQSQGREHDTIWIHVRKPQTTELSSNIWLISLGFPPLWHVKAWPRACWAVYCQWTCTNGYPLTISKVLRQLSMHAFQKLDVSPLSDHMHPCAHFVLTWIYVN